MYFDTSHLALSMDGEATDTWRIIAFKGHAALNDDFQFQIDWYTRSSVYLKSLFGKTLCLEVGYGLQIFGIVTCCAQETGSQQQGDHYSLTFQSLLSQLRNKPTMHTWLNRTPEQVLKDLLLRHQIAQPLFEWNIKPLSPWRTQVQYQESDWHCFQRIISRSSLTYLLQPTSRMRMLITDDVRHLNTQGEPVVHYHEPQGMPRSGVCYDYEIHQTTHPKTLKVRGDIGDYPSSICSAEASLSSGGVGKIVIDECCLQDQVDADRYVKHQLAALTQQRWLLVLYCTTLDYWPGQVIRWALDDKRYRIIRAEFSVDEGQGQSIPGREGLRAYQKLTLVPADDPVVIPYDQYPLKRRAMLMADILGGGDVSPVDAEGRYQAEYLRGEVDPAVKPRDDVECSAQTPPMPFAQPLVGQHFGQHFPLDAKTRVVVAHVNGDLHQPWILGVMPHDNAPSPVTSANRKQHVVRTRKGHEWVQDDTKQHAFQQLKTANGNQWLRFSEEKGESNITLKNIAGTLHFTAGKSYELQSEGNLYQTIAGKHQVNIGDQYSLHCQSDIHYHAHTDLQVLAQKDIQSEANESAHITQASANYISQGNQVWQCDGDFDLSVDDEAIMQAGKALQISGDHIVFKTGLSKCTIINGKLTLEGKHITMIGNVGEDASEPTEEETPVTLPPPVKQEKNRKAIRLETISALPRWRKQLPTALFGELGTLLRLPHELQAKIIQSIQARYTPKTPEAAEELAIPSNLKDWTKHLNDPALITQAKHALYLNQAAELNPGWVYIFAICPNAPQVHPYHALHLYKEYAILNYGEACVYSEVNLEQQAGLDQRTPAGEGASIELPYQYIKGRKSLGRFHVYVMYSSVQLSWPRIHRYGGIDVYATCYKHLPEAQKTTLQKLQSQSSDTTLFKKRFGQALPQDKLEEAFRAQYKKKKTKPEPLSGTEQPSAWRRTSLYFTHAKQSIPFLLLDDPLGMVQTGNAITINLFTKLRATMDAIKHKKIKVRTEAGETERCFYQTAILTLQLFLKYNYPDIVKQNGYYTSTRDPNGKELPWAKAQGDLNKSLIAFCLNHHEREVLHQLIAQSQKIVTNILLQSWNQQDEQPKPAPYQGAWAVDIIECIIDFFAQPKATFAKGYVALYALYGITCEDSHVIDEKIHVDNQYINESHSYAYGGGSNQVITHYKKVKRYDILKTQVDTMIAPSGKTRQLAVNPPKLIKLNRPAGFAFVKALHQASFPLHHCIFPGEPDNSEQPYLNAQGKFNPEGLRYAWGNTEHAQHRIKENTEIKHGTDAFRSVLAHYAEHASEFNPTINKVVEASQVVEADQHIKSLYYQLLQHASNKDYRSIVKHLLGNVKKSKDLQAYLSIDGIKSAVHNMTATDLITAARNSTGLITLYLSIWDLKDEIVTATEQSMEAKGCWLTLACITRTMINMGGAISGLQESLSTVLGQERVEGWINNNELGQWCEEKTQAAFGKRLGLTDVITRWAVVSDVFNLAGTTMHLVNDLTGVGLRDPARVVGDVFDAGGNAFFSGAAAWGLADASNNTAAIRISAPLRDIHNAEAATDTTSMSLEATDEFIFGAITAPELFVFIGIGCIIVSNVASLFQHNQFQDWVSGCVFNKNGHFFKDWQQDKNGQFRALVDLLILPQFTLPKLKHHGKYNPTLTFKLAIPSLFGLFSEAHPKIHFDNQWIIACDQAYPHAIRPQLDHMWERTVTIPILHEEQKHIGYPVKLCQYHYDDIEKQIHAETTSAPPYTHISLELIPRGQLKLNEGIIPAQAIFPGEAPGWISKHIHWLSDILGTDNQHEDNGIRIKDGFWIGLKKLFYEDRRR
jgi:hypothetical protein